MSYRITLDIAEDSEIGRLIESVAAREQLSREEAALKLSQNGRNDAASAPAKVESEPTAQEKRQAAINRVTGSLQGPDWLWAEFEVERQADIERENARAELCFLFLLRSSSIAARF